MRSSSQSGVLCFSIRARFTDRKGDKPNQWQQPHFDVLQAEIAVVGWLRATFGYVCDRLRHLSELSTTLCLISPIGCNQFVGLFVLGVLRQLGEGYNGMHNGDYDLLKRLGECGNFGGQLSQQMSG